MENTNPAVVACNSELKKIYLHKAFCERLPHPSDKATPIGMKVDVSSTIRKAEEEDCDFICESRLEVIYKQGEIECIAKLKCTYRSLYSNKNNSYEEIDNKNVGHHLLKRNYPYMQKTINNFLLDMRVNLLIPEVLPEGIIKSA